MTGRQLVAAHQAAVAELCRQYGVVRLRLFGSALRASWRPQDSDLDFLADFGSPPVGINLFEQQFGFQADLEKLFRRRVDVVDWNAARKPHFRESAEKHAKEVFAIANTAAT